MDLNWVVDVRRFIMQLHKNKNFFDAAMNCREKKFFVSFNILRAVRRRLLVREWFDSCFLFAVHDAERNSNRGGWRNVTTKELYRRKSAQTRNKNVCSAVRRVSSSTAWNLHTRFFTTISQDDSTSRAISWFLSFFFSYLTLWRCFSTFPISSLKSLSLVPTLVLLRCEKLHCARDDKKIRRKTNRKKKLQAKNHDELIGRESFSPICCFNGLQSPQLWTLSDLFEGNNNVD